MRTILADTGPLYALLDRSDRHHGTAHSQLEILHRSELRLLVAQPILLESYSLVSRKLGLRVAQRWLQEIERGVGMINPTASDYDAARAVVADYPDQAITLFDASLAVLSWKLQAVVWTFDFHFDVLRSDVWRPSADSPQ